MHTTTLLTALLAVVPALSQPLNPSLQSLLDTRSNNTLYKYPTSLTQDIVPKGLHSHNDYWRPLPLYSALASGAISVEADVWLFNGTLHVGHDLESLTRERTFTSLYINPLLDVLNKQNPNGTFGNSATKNGVYDAAVGQTLYLFVDLKTEGAAAWNATIRALQPLRTAGYLTTFNGSTIRPGPVTVVGTGNTPRRLVEGVMARDYFWDVPLGDLNKTEFANVTSRLGPIASTSFSSAFGEVRAGVMNSTQTEKLRAQVKLAKERGMKVRYWGAPIWPRYGQKKLWTTLWEEGVDLLNVDDLEGAAAL